MKAQIKGAFDTKKSGEELITTDGDMFYKLLLVTEDEQAVYPAFFLNAKSYWVTENLFKSAGVPCPQLEDITFKDFQDLEGKTVDVSVGNNKKGYLSVLKWFPALSSGADVVEAEAVEEPIDEVAEQSANDLTDPDLDEDVPF